VAALTLLEIGNAETNENAAKQEMMRIVFFITPPISEMN
jgi:hypothetical protein